MTVNVTKNKFIGSGGSSTPSAYPGEVKLFAMQNGQAAPEGFEFDTHREVPSGVFASVTGIIAAAKADTSHNLNSAVLGDYLYTATSTAVTKTRLSDGVVVATFSHGISFTQGNRPAIAAVGSSIVMTGGATASTPRADVYRMNVDTGVFTRLTDMVAGRVHHSLAALDSSRFLIIGGHTTTAETAPADTVWLYDLTASTCTLVANLSVAAAYVKAARLPSGNVLTLGGLNASAQAVQTYQVFNASSNTISAAKSIPVDFQQSQPRETVTLRTSNGAAYIFGSTTTVNCFAEYHEASDSFGAFQGVVPTGFRSAQTGTTTNSVCTDLAASSYGHIVPVYGNHPLLLIGSGYAPTYRYLRKI